jgi:DNA-binding LytR/AlgR family response regulator
MILNCVIVDDERPAIRVLERFVDQTPWLRLEASFQNPQEALGFLKDHPADLLLLDIQMPKMSGLDLLEKLDANPLVIFTTAYPDYALQGFEWAAVDYLLKPIAYDRFLRSATRALQLKTSRSPEDTHLTIRADKRLYRVSREEILYIQAYGDYLKIQTRERQYTPKMTLQEWEQRLPDSDFIRVHRSWIVNLSQVEYLEGNHLVIGGEKIPVSESYRSELLERWKPS